MSSLSNLKEQLEKKRKEAQLKNNNNNNNNSIDKSDEPVTKKYKTRGEIEKELKQKKEEERIKKEKENNKSNVNSNKNENNLNTNSSNNNNDDSNDNNNKSSKENEEFLPDIVVIQRLRERSQPITYFGETSIDRAMRLKKLEENDPIEYTQGDNEFANILKQIEQKKMKKHQDSADNEKEKEESNNNNSNNNNNNNYNNNNNNNKKQKDDENEENEEKELERLKIEATKCKESKILYFLKGLLNDWITNLENRSDEEKKSRQGKIVEATYYQCKSHIQPLFTSLKEKTLSTDILDHINQIVDFCKSREYVRANDEYLQMAIGNAPWPMGVTMVGIHERSSREKIFSNQVAHVLNDEMQRKYIQAVKRLMTFCQQQYPTAPSRSVG
ncbi:hypothetical protein ACTFIV_003040 [Dictyostelium citrinum]